MNNTFNGWEHIDYNNLDIVADYILTGKTVKEFNPDTSVYEFLDKSKSLTILDFGCGIGRNTYGMANYSSMWSLIGYDNLKMLNLTSVYCKLKYDKLFSNIRFINDWELVKNIKFDVIYCSLVLQHIYEKDLNVYLNDFKNMTGKLIVHSRRFNDDRIDDKYKNTWKILENNGLTPSNRYEVDYAIEGNPEEHTLCIYDIK